MIEVNKITVQRGGRTILEDVTVTAPAGACTVVLGPNGSGKSTLLAAICGDLPLAAGTIRLNGTPTHGLPPVEGARQRAVMTQSVGVAFGFTVREVVAMGRAPWHGLRQSTDDEQIIDQAMVAADVTQLAQRPVQALSGGEQARVAWARALAQDTPILILDEPVAALDLRHQVATMATATARARLGRTVLVVLHDLTLAARFADHVIVMNGGRVAATGETASILTPQVLEPIYGLSLLSLQHPQTGTTVILPAD